MKRSGAIEYASYASFENTGQCISLQHLDDGLRHRLDYCRQPGDVAHFQRAPRRQPLYAVDLRPADLCPQHGLHRLADCPAARQLRPVELLQIAINFVFSAAIDFFMHAMAGLQGLNWPFAAVLLVAGCATLAFGICIEVASQVLMVPGDGAVKAIAQTGKWWMGSTKVAFDSTMVTIAVILSTLYGGLGTLTGLGVGTLVSAMLVGRFVNFFNRRVFLIERLARLSLDDETKAAGALSKEIQS